MSNQPLVVVFVASCATGLMACPPTQEPPPKTQEMPPMAQESSPRAQGDAVPDRAPLLAAGAAGACPADPAWLTSSTLPREVPGNETICNFEQFMWQSMLALVQPTQAGPTTLQFETWMPSYGIFIKNGTPTPWGQEPPSSCGAIPKSITGKAQRFYSDITKQAGSDQALIDRKGELVYYGISVNKSAYDMITGCQLYKANCAGPLKPQNQGIDLIQKYPDLAFPDSAVEIKTSWMVLDDAAAGSGLYYVVPGLVQDKGRPCHQVNLGLTGIHIVSKTPNFPALIWATFEHRNNAPDCSDTSAAPPLGGSWNFFDPSCKNCSTNTHKENTPAQICRMHPQGNSAVGTFPGGADCSTNPSQFACREATRKMLDESTQAIRSINAAVQALIRESPQRINKVWANYELVGNVWTVGRTVPPYQQAQQGSLSDANTSMESFVQNGVAAVTNTYNCLSCHNMAGPTSGQSLPPVGLSHLFDSVQMSGGCEDGTLPAACKAYTGSQK